jgi:hypothetical protein
MSVRTTRTNLPVARPTTRRNWLNLVIAALLVLIVPLIVSIFLQD